MNLLIASVYSIDSYSRGIMPDVLQQQINENPTATIYYLSCFNTFDVCYFNLEKKPEICYRCKKGVENTLKLIEGNFINLKISDLILDVDRKTAIEFFERNPEINFNLKYEDFELGAATLSTYISRTRDRDLISVDQNFVRELAFNALLVYLGVKRFVKDREIEKVFNFNGRQDYVRAIMRATMANEINCINVERARLGGYIEAYINVLPHNIINKWNLVQQCWNNSAHTEKEKYEIGTNFYERQKSGESILFPSYTGSMKKGNLPDTIHNGNKNIVLFNSSDDEFAALGKEYDNPYFKDQIDALQNLTTHFGTSLNSYNLIIRMHPNLKGVNHSFVTKILELDKSYPNIFVIAPESSTDSYSLINIAEKVISFGSTTGLEANFFRKPVILLGKGLYYYSLVAYVPKDVPEIYQLLKSNLTPKPLLDTIKFGYYFLEGGFKAEFYYEDSNGGGIFFKNVRIHEYSSWQRLQSKIIQLSYRFLNLRLKPN